LTHENDVSASPFFRSLLAGISELTARVTAVPPYSRRRTVLEPTAARDDDRHRRGAHDHDLAAIGAAPRYVHESVSSFQRLARPRPPLHSLQWVCPTICMFQSQWKVAVVALPTAAVPAPSWRKISSLRLLFWVALALCVGTAIYFLFGNGLYEVVRSFRKPEFSHGYIVPAISAWIVWRRRQLIWSRRRRGAWTGVLLVGAGVTIALVGHAAGLRTPPFVGLPLVLLGLTAATLGWSAARFVVVPAAFLFFSYPIPNYFYIELSTSLQLVSSQIGAGLLDALDVPVFLDGNIIDLGTMQLQVAEACSGLRYLLPLVCFGTLCAFIYRAPWWAKLLVVLITLPLTIVLNGLRIAATGLFVHFGSREWAEGFMHLFEGWVVFLLALALLFAFMVAVQRLRGWRYGVADMLDFDRLDGTPTGHPPAPPTAPPPSTALPRPLLLAVAMTVLAALLLGLIGQREHVVPARRTLQLFPMHIAEYVATPRFLDPPVARELGADDYVLLDFKHRKVGQTINFWVAYYDVLLDQGEIHLPTACLPGSGFEFVEFGAHRTGLTDFSGQPLMVNRSVIAKGSERMVMYYWMELRGRAVNRSHHVKFINLWDSLISGRSNGALVRLYTPLAAGEEAGAGDGRLLEFLEHLYPRLVPYLNSAEPRGQAAAAPT